MTPAGEWSWWPQRRRRDAVAVAAALFIAVYVLRLVVDDPRDATSVLYSIPIALLAVAFGVRGGLIGAAIGMALFAEWSATAHPGVPALGWIVRAAVMLLIGVVVGYACDEMARHGLRAQEEHAHRLALEEQQRREIEALEINDSIIQAMVAAKWMVELGQADGAVGTLSDAIGVGQELVAGMLPPTVTPGSLTRRAAAGPGQP
jgi:glucose-6-phosphate-specific signal transduction histidine kinase